MRTTALVLGASMFFISFAAAAQESKTEAPPAEPAPAAPAAAETSPGAPVPAEPASAEPAATPAAPPPAATEPAPVPEERTLLREGGREEASHAPAPPRDHGMRLALDLSFARSTGEAIDRVNAGSPSLVPLGADVSWRTSRKVLLGFHGHLALASRDDCLGDVDCTGRGYGLGTHVEAAFTAGGTFIPYFRYGLGWEMIHQMGGYKNADAYRYRHAFDILDVRFGGDFVIARGAAGRTSRIGPFVGMIAGVTVDEVSSGRGSEADAGAGHFWFTIGARGTTDW